MTESRTNPEPGGELLPAESQVSVETGGDVPSGRGWAGRAQALCVGLGVPAGLGAGAAAVSGSGVGHSLLAGVAAVAVSGVVRLLLRRQDNAHKRDENAHELRVLQTVIDLPGLESADRRDAALAALRLLRENPAEPFRPD